MTRRHDIESLVQAYLDRLEVGAEPAQAAEDLAKEHPNRAEEFRRALESLAETGLQRVIRPQARMERLGDFMLEDRLGGGGMGVVHRARQLSVDRAVALKVIRADHLFIDGARERFQREVDAVARLAHPNIAALYTVGEEGGVPYCAMELIHGPSLDVALRRIVGTRVEVLTGQDFRRALHQGDESVDPSTVVDPGFFDGSWVVTCIRIVREVAHALEHAHERGVLHRDVKPSNVCVTAGGRVALLDFGLATLRESHGLTATGVAVGSMPYMAPEQAAGRTDEVDERSDVYGLGVLLYELLALRPAFAGRNVEALRSAILDGRTTPLRKLCPDLPRDIEVVVAKAMDVDRERRYASALALARDLSNILERKPVSARPAGPLLRLDRLVRRRPAASIAVVLGVLLAVGGPLFFALVQYDHSKELEGTLLETDAHLTSALDAVGEVLGPLSDRTLADSPGMQGQRLMMLRRALALVDDVAVHRAGDVRVRLLRARLESQLGGALLDQGDSEAGTEHLHRADAALESLHEDETGVASKDVIAAFASCRSRLATERIQSGDLQCAEEWFDSVAALLAEACVRFPGDERLVLERAQLHARLGVARSQSGLDEESEREFSLALDIVRDAARRFSGSAHVHAMHGAILIQAYGARVEPLGAGFKPGPEDEAMARSAVAAYERARELEPERRSIQVGLARSVSLLGSHWSDADRHDDAITELERAAAMHDALVARFPEARPYAIARLEAARTLADALHAGGKRHAALEVQGEVAQQSVALADSAEIVGAAHLQAIGAAINLSGQLMNMDDLGIDRYARARSWLGEARRLMVDYVEVAPPRRGARLEFFIENIDASIYAEEGDHVRASETLIAAQEKVGRDDAASVASLAEAWAVLYHHVPEGDPLREANFDRAVESLVHALELGLSTEMLSSDYLALIRDDPRVRHAESSRGVGTGD